MHIDFFLTGFVSCENKGAVILIPKLEVAGPSLVARSIFPHPASMRKESNLGGLLFES
jgi:hypothetical protein